MPPASAFTPAPGDRVTVGGVPPGLEALLIPDLLRRSTFDTALHVAPGSRAAAATCRALRFFAPEIEVLAFPAWDCLPYDRAPASRAVVGRRIETLIQLGGRRRARSRVVVTTAAALLQRLPPAEILEDATFRLNVGERLDRAALEAFLLRDGYTAAGAVREPGQFAFHPEVIDLFPADERRPVRVELDGEAIRRLTEFDPVSQRSTANGRDDACLMPASEAVLTPDTVARFRRRYRKAFGEPPSDDPVFATVSEGRRYPGMAHLLPLFYDRMDTLFGYLTAALVTLDEAAEQRRDAQLAQIRDAYHARRTMSGFATDGHRNHRTLAPDALYLDAAEWQDALRGRSVVRFQAAPAQGFDAGGRAGPDAPLAAEDFRARVSRLVDAGKALLADAGVGGSRAAVARSLRRLGAEDPRPVDTWPDARALPRGVVGITGIGVEQSFEAPDVAVLAQRDVPGRRPTARARRPSSAFADAGRLSPGDLVVHAEHGIGRFEGLEVVRASGTPEECLRLVYRNDARLLVPIEDLHLVAPYGREEDVPLDLIGGRSWPERKRRARARVRKIAAKLAAEAAERRARTTQPIRPPDPEYERFVARFPHVETPDQEAAVADVIADLGSGRPMDRLICGDVGFGKTEIALRAAFLVAAAGRQVAVVAPTTPLCRQHYDDLCARFAGFAVAVAQLSRSVPPKQAGVVKDGIARGDVAIVVGTHALLSDTVRFRDLGLLIVDEEQRFGARQKRALRRLGDGVHVLTMTATPIPRTLELALGGLQDISVLATPPAERQPVRTFALPFDPVVVREALLRERARGGQSFYVCPRLDDLPIVRDRLRALAPELTVARAHGKLKPAAMDDMMAVFAQGAADVLLATNIVESGLNIPNANTLVVHRADLFGLAELHQLRGRVGRSTTQGYAYLTHEPGAAPAEDAAARLRTLVEIETLGGGFRIAARDMTLRGVGNLLGDDQSGHVRDVGAEMLQRLLKDAAEAARHGGKRPERWSPRIHAALPVLIPEGYVPDPAIRLDFYRRLSEAWHANGIEDIADELEDRFGSPPAEVETLLALTGLRRLCRQAGIGHLDIGPKGVSFAFRNGRLGRDTAAVLRQQGCKRSRATGNFVLPAAGGRAALDRALALLRRVVGD